MSVQMFWCDVNSGEDSFCLPRVKLQRCIKLSYHPHKDKYKSLFVHSSTPFRKTKENFFFIPCWGIFTALILNLLPIYFLSCSWNTRLERIMYVCALFNSSEYFGQHDRPHKTYDISVLFVTIFYTNMSIPRERKLMPTLMCSLHAIKNG